MVKYFAIVAIVGGTLAYLGFRFLVTKTQPKGTRSMNSIYDLAFSSIDGKSVPLNQFKGKKILFINVASECGFTPQYDDIEKLYQKYQDRMIVIGFPANDFGSQEPGTNEQIASFCTSKYHVTFPLAQKSSVVGANKNPIYRWLTDKTQNGWNNTEPKWNFGKYLVSAEGELLKVYPSKTKPLDDEIISEIQK
jgi:glutathione peroxidase